MMQGRKVLGVDGARQEEESQFSLVAWLWNSGMSKKDTKKSTGREMGDQPNFKVGAGNGPF